jgi:hypothetical protein
VKFSVGCAALETLFYRTSAEYAISSWNPAIQRRFPSKVVQTRRGRAKTRGYRVKSFVMAKISNPSLDSTARGECTAFARAGFVAMGSRNDLAGISTTTKTISIKTITFR